MRLQAALSSGVEGGGAAGRPSPRTREESHSPVWCIHFRADSCQEKKKGASVLVLAETPKTTDAFARLPPLFSLSVSLWPPSDRLGFDTAS